MVNMNPSSCLKIVILLHQLLGGLSQYGTYTSAPTVSSKPSLRPSVSLEPSLSPAPSKVPSVSLVPTVTTSPTTIYGVSRGSCYLGGGSVVCDQSVSMCTDLGSAYWYEPGFISNYSGCCHCKASCPSALIVESCNYYDDYDTDAPTSVPLSDSTGTPTVEEESGDAGDALCFSPHAIARVLGKGRVAMQDLVPGDKVLTASGEHKTMFSMNHYHQTKTTVFLRIQTDLEMERPLELSPNHMVFVEAAKKHPVPAASVNIGDKIWSADDGLREVVDIETVVREGLYNPLTMDGTIVVDGIVASTYTSYTGSVHLKIGETNVVSFHALMDMAIAPYRIMCTGISLSLCNNHGELSHATTFMKALYASWAKQGDTLKSMFLLMYVAFFGASAILMFLKSYVVVNTAILFVVTEAAGCMRKNKV